MPRVAAIKYNDVYINRALRKELSMNAIKFVVAIVLSAFSSFGFAQNKDGEAIKQMLVGKTVTVQGVAVPYYKVTLNADGSFLHCAPTTMCEVSGRWSVDSGGKLVRKYKLLFNGGERSGVVTDSTFSGAKILGISQSPMVALGPKDIETLLVGKTVNATNPQGEKSTFSFTADGKFQECLSSGTCPAGVWKLTDGVLMASYDKWRPSFAKDGIVSFPMVKDGDTVYFRDLLIK